ncbi:MAG: hypothetical protein GX061_06355 [Eubacteriaceae bacterium]|jgi:hypothetical protein|nr:hypothetical protein [Eubacteriaceae bacterium]
MIKRILIAHIPQCTNLIRRNSPTPADSFGITEQNAPRFTAFAVSEEKLLKQFTEENRSMYAYFVGKTPIELYSLSR